MAELIEPRNQEEVARGDFERIGDRAGEYMNMERGRYDAWIYVGIAFLYHLALIGVILGGIGFGVSAAAFGAKEFAAYFGGGVLLALPITWLFYRDRWRCIEAYSSRYCSGVANLSMVYVPVVSFIYASVRAGQKLRGK